MRCPPPPPLPTEPDDSRLLSIPPCGHSACVSAARRTFGFTTRRDRRGLRLSFPSHATPGFQTLSGLAAAWTQSTGPLPYPAEAEGGPLGSREWTMETPVVFLLCISVFPGFSQGRVVGRDEAGFAECNVFFPGQVPPKGFTQPFHVKICQQYNKEPRFATLYSTKDKIPLYSAFKYTKAAQSEEESWLVEPQIDDPENDLQEMVHEADIAGTVANLGANQALTSDYVDSGYERGLLNPSLLNEEDFQMATYTLTNAVPLSPSVSKSWHRDIGKVVEEGLVPHCSKKDHLYLLAGAIPSRAQVKGKLSVPETLWLAACCDAPDGWSLGIVKSTNDDNSLADLTVRELEKKLLTGVRLFKGSCGEDNQSQEKTRAILQAVSQVRSGEQVRASESQDAKESGLVRKVAGIIATPFIKLLELLIYVLVELVKYVFYFLWLVIKRVGGTVLDGVCNLWNGVVFYLKSITMVLISIPYDVGRVIVNIFMGFLQIVEDVASLTYRILRIPVGFVLHLAAFPYHSICAIPSVLKDMANGIGGTFSLVIDATATILHGFYYLACHIVRRFVPKASSDD
ncbi:LOW QUALITY PROTEIN: endonuclease domain-containing 1 protein [Melopsittacus undulatus]|uniref:LOW QUALITY PROTEIN: endonuclease domain-containing 1 protein n=1 Tax=Melopsittacus undulatus TaxID=13146 RepID=UPI00146BA401|nr:LOW QUALITY PROTEIN: endonuclease domain-containing 1 protein [Melopsittacus undulatus]